MNKAKLKELLKGIEQEKVAKYVNKGCLDKNVENLTVKELSQIGIWLISEGSGNSLAADAIQVLTERAQQKNLSIF